jgi:hypothetical protein
MNTGHESQAGSNANLKIDLLVTDVRGHEIIKEVQNSRVSLCDHYRNVFCLPSQNGQMSTLTYSSPSTNPQNVISSFTSHCLSNTFIILSHHSGTHEGGAFFK